MTFSRIALPRRVVFAICMALACVPFLFLLDVLAHCRGIGQGQELSCAYTSRCLPNYGNTSVCESLIKGTTERELIFRLGQPIVTSGSTLYFEAGAGEPGPIRVELDAHRRAARFACRPAG
jgi:hypothetical protein